MEDFSRAVNYSMASSGSRFANHIIDHIVFYVFSSVLSFLIPWDFFTLLDFDLNNSVIFVFFYLLLSLFIFALFYSVQEYIFKGRTIGKFVTGTKVVTVNGNEPGFGKIIIRSLCRLIPFEAFSFIFSSAGWHDTLSGTRVIKISEFEILKSRYNEIDQIGSGI